MSCFTEMGSYFGWLWSVALDRPQSLLAIWGLEDSTPATHVLLSLHVCRDKPIVLHWPPAGKPIESRERPGQDHPDPAACFCVAVRTSWGVSWRDEHGSDRDDCISGVRPFLNPDRGADLQPDDSLRKQPLSATRAKLRRQRNCLSIRTLDFCDYNRGTALQMLELKVS